MLENVLLIGVAFALGGILKGATGAGAPLLAIPILALLYDVPTAITLFAIPNLVPNVWQAWKYRADSLPTRFWLQFAIAGGVGAAIGTYGLANIKSDYLLLVVALVVVAYIIFRTLRPGWVLTYPKALAAVLPVGLIAGILQGSGGISAPVSITFLNAMKLSRGQ
ncbi:MAG TPA: sulfite exporter TauE/SafE family protein, partial [Rhodobacteraceae bacterium]|nr:sulfite exporter TauE/SafE family protein [Paracoccaceae bacterium]